MYKMRVTFFMTLQSDSSCSCFCHFQEQMISTTETWKYRNGLFLLILLPPIHLLLHLLFILLLFLLRFIFSFFALVFSSSFSLSSPSSSFSSSSSTHHPSSYLLVLCPSLLILLGPLLTPILILLPLLALLLHLPCTSWFSHPLFLIILPSFIPFLF
jgi:hypothetical protein